MSRMTIRLGTRASKLALTQTHHVAGLLRRVHPGLDIEIIPVHTTGDKILDTPLSRIGGKGVFTKEIEEALLGERIDVAVHSLKDLPTVQPEGLALAAIPGRESPLDILIAREEIDWKALGPEARVGTSSLRRRAQLRIGNPHVRIDDLRGNVPTRIRKVVEGEYDAIVLAAAGVRRLELSPPFGREMTPEEMLPAPGQGALGLQIRSGDEYARGLLAPLHDGPAAACCIAERALLHGLGGGCQLPLGAQGEIAGEVLILRGRVVSLDGRACIEGERQGSWKDAEQIGLKLAEDLLARGARRIVEELGLGDVLAGFHEAVARAEAMDSMPLGGKVVLVTRDEDSDGPLSQVLRALGGQPLCLPLVKHLPPEDEGPLRQALGQPDHFDWIVLTSFRAVEAVAGILGETGRRLGDFPGRIACVGEATARAVARAGGVAQLAPEEGTAEALAAELVAAGVDRGARVLYPRSSEARPVLRDALVAAGAELSDPIAYRTVKVQAAEVVEEVMRSRRPDAALFCSPSAVEAFSNALGGEGLGLVAGVVVGSIGPATSEALRSAGLDPAFETEERSFEGLAKALARWYSEA